MIPWSLVVELKVPISTSPEEMVIVTSWLAKATLSSPINMMSYTSPNSKSVSSLRKITFDNLIGTFPSIVTLFSSTTKIFVLKV